MVDFVQDIKKRPAAIDGESPIFRLNGFCAEQTPEALLISRGTLVFGGSFVVLQYAIAGQGKYDG